MARRDTTERLLFVSRLGEGDEAEVREAVERGFPADAFAKAGVTGFTAHVGGGYCVFEFGFEGPFAPVFDRLNADKAARAYLEGLGEHVDPPPRIRPGSTAGQPIAADQFLWRLGSGVKARSPSPRPKKAAKKPAAATGGGRR